VIEKAKKVNVENAKKVKTTKEITKAPLSKAD